MFTAPSIWCQVIRYAMSCVKPRKKQSENICNRLVIKVLRMFFVAQILPLGWRR